MADDLKGTVRKIKKGVRDVARSSPVIAVGEALTKVGEKVIEHTPEPVRKVGRRLKRAAGRALSGSSGRVRRHQRMRRKNTARRSSRR